MQRLSVYIGLTLLTNMMIAILLIFLDFTELTEQHVLIYPNLGYS